MRRDKEKCFKLRKQGKTYREIQKEIKISRSTLTAWFKNEKWSKHTSEINTKKHIKISTERLLKMHNANRIILERKYRKKEEEAEREFELYKNDSLFIAGIMLYIGEGDKSSKGNIRLANVDFLVHKIFIKFMKKFLGGNRENIKFSTLLYPDLNIEKCRKKWSDELGIPITNFHKPIVINGRLKTRRLQFGVGSTIMSSTFSKRKLYKWIDLSENYLST